MLYTLFITLTFGAVYYIWLKLENKKEQSWKQANSKKILYDFVKSRIDGIQDANVKFTSYQKNNNGYFSNYQITSWKEQYNSLHAEIDGKTFEDIGLGNDELAAVKEFVHCNERLPLVRNNSIINLSFMSGEFYKDFFKKIEKHGLDGEQQIAVITNEDNNIVIAGAGSGKTTTIVGKVRYIIQRYKILPSEIHVDIIY